MDISVSTNIQSILDQFPSLADALIESYPGLIKINNPIYRSTILKASTVAQVAASVSIDPDDLVMFINNFLHKDKFPEK